MTKQSSVFVLAVFAGMDNLTLCTNYSPHFKTLTTVKRTIQFVCVVSWIICFYIEAFTEDCNAMQWIITRDSAQFSSSPCSSIINRSDGAETTRRNGRQEAAEGLPELPVGSPRRSTGPEREPWEGGLLMLDGHWADGRRRSTDGQG